MATSKDIAKALQVTEQTVRQWARDGRIPFEETPGRHRRYDLESVRLALRLEQPRSFEPLDFEHPAEPRLSDANRADPLVRAPRWDAVPVGEALVATAEEDLQIPFPGRPGSSRFIVRS